jgi:hypothetical protein
VHSNDLRPIGAEGLARLVQFSTSGIKMLDGSVLRGEVVLNPIAFEGGDPPGKSAALREPAVILDFVLGRASA